MARPAKLMLLDSASLWFRAFYGVPDSVRAPNGHPVNAVRGFVDHIARLVREHNPTDLVACLDEDWRPEFRVAAVPSYKSHRVVEFVSTNAPDVEEVPDLLSPQIPLILDVLNASGIAVVGSPGYEADDVIGTIAAAAQIPTDVVTGDRDLFQVIRPGVRVLYTVDKGRPYDDAAVSAKYGIPTAAAYGDFALLRGDPSDGLPGVPGIGEKTAATLLTRYGSVPALLAALDAGEDVPVAGKLAKGRAYLEAAAPVMAVRTDVPLGRFISTLPAKPTEPATLAGLAAEHGLDSSIERLTRALADNSSTDSD
jgi:5'-3' exonuclease